MLIRQSAYLLDNMENCPYLSHNTEWIPRIVHSADSKILHANQAFLELLGRPASPAPQFPTLCLSSSPSCVGISYQRVTLPHHSGPYVTLLLATVPIANTELFESVALPLDSGTPAAPNLVPLLLAQDDENSQILARELHDTTAQTLAALAINLSILTNLTASSIEAQRILTECTQLTNAALLEVRRTSYRLYPPLLAELGLAPALRNYVQIFQTTTAIETQLDVDPAWQRLPKHDEHVLFRIVQERLNYLETYGDATECLLQLAASPTTATITITDNSDSEVAFLPLDHPLRYSFAVLQERANSISADLRIENTSRSTRIHAIIARS